jgi:hypothetical protein
MISLDHYWTPSNGEVWSDVSIWLMKEEECIVCNIFTIQATDRIKHPQVLQLGMYK